MAKILRVRRAQDRAKKIRHMAQVLIEDPMSMPPALARTLDQWTRDLIEFLQADTLEGFYCDHCNEPSSEYFCSEACKKCHSESPPVHCIGTCGKQ